MRPVAIIPARGGSKRLPRKNILPLKGRPLLYYPVRAALDSRLFDRVIVSTEDGEIRAAAEKSGAEVIHRPARLARDKAGVAQVCLDVLARLADQGCCPDWFCCIYATAVFITGSDLESAFSQTRERPVPDMVMAVSKFNLSPFQALADQGGWLAPVWPGQCMKQSQCHPRVVASNGTFYWGRTSAFVEHKTFYPEQLWGFELPWSRAIDINTPEDYGLACKLAEIFLQHGKGPA